MATASGILYRRGFGEEHRRAAARVYDDAFGEKLSSAIACRSQRIDILRDGFEPRYSFAAFSRDGLVGLAGIHTRDGALTSGITARALMRRLGVARGLRACAILALYERTPAPGELVMDGIAVDRGHRGRGIGGALLDCIVELARWGGYRRVRLDVIDSNPGAKRLYRAKGFEVTREESYPVLRPLLGFRGSSTMELELSGRG